MALISFKSCLHYFVLVLHVLDFVVFVPIIAAAVKLQWKKVMLYLFRKTLSRSQTCGSHKKMKCKLQMFAIRLWYHTIVQKFHLDKTLTFSQVFHPNFFWQFFSWNQSCQQLKSPKPQHFHKFFTPKKIDNFSREIKVVNS